MTENRNPIPTHWCGLWTDKNGKQLIIESAKHHFYSVTVLDPGNNPFQINLLGDEKKVTLELKGQFCKDLDGNLMLQVEAGTEGIGPTYRLYFLVAKDQSFRPAKNTDEIKKIIIRPTIGIGLYDDYEDDLGVPWAFPLEDFKKKPK